jgi:FkbM family methyltransferase
MQLLPVVIPGQPIFHLLLDESHDVWIAPSIRDNRQWEPSETALFQRVIARGDQVVDVGAHVGYFTVLFSRLTGADGNVVAFEPEPDNNRLLRANLLLNDCRNAVAEALALSDKEGDAALFLSADNGGDHRLHAAPGRRRRDIRTTTLDAHLSGRAVDFIKIDTQGAEPLVLEGMHATIERSREQLGVLMEYAPGLLERYGAGVGAFIAQLDALGARVFSLSCGGGTERGAQDSAPRLNRAASTQVLLRALAAELGKAGFEDASGNLLVFFSETAERRFLARLGAR